MNVVNLAESGWTHLGVCRLHPMYALSEHCRLMPGASDQTFIATDEPGNPGYCYCIECGHDDPILGHAKGTCPDTCSQCLEFLSSVFREHHAFSVSPVERVRLRALSGWSISDIACLAGCSRSTIRRWETSTGCQGITPGIRALAKYSLFLLLTAEREQWKMRRAAS
jgi:hypothetical protein